MQLSAVDQLVCYLATDPRSACQMMRVAGFTEEQVLQAWIGARLARFTLSPGSADRLTEVGRTRAREIANRHE